MNTYFKQAIIVIMILVVTGCAHIPAGFAPSVSPLTKDQQDSAVIKHVEGSQSYFSFLGFLPFSHPKYNSAIEDALEETPDAKTIINARSWYTSTWIIIGTVYTLHVEGDAVK